MMQGATYEGVGFEGKICGVSILRAGEVSVILLILGGFVWRLDTTTAGYGGRPQGSLQECQDWQDPDPAGTYKPALYPLRIRVKPAFRTKKQLSPSSSTLKWVCNIPTGTAHPDAPPL